MSTPSIPSSGLPLPEKIPPQYEMGMPDMRTPLMLNGQVMGVFTRPDLMAESRRFLEKLNGGAL